MIRLRYRKAFETHCGVSRPHADDGGWALLGLLLALSVIAIMLLGILPSVQMEVRRDKEIEMMYRGEQMAEAIARYYNRGTLAGIQLNVPPPYGYLYDLKKLRDGVQMGVIELKFVRPSAIVDPLTNEEWEPVRARDPRLSGALQAFAAAKQVPIPPSYMLLAGPPSRLKLVNPSEQGTPAITPNRPPAGVEAPAKQPPTNKEADDSDDDDDDNEDDPVSRLLRPGENALPIVAVAPRLRGPSIRALWGLKNYEEWVFIYIPQTQMRPGMIRNPSAGQGDRQRLQ